MRSGYKFQGEIPIAVITLNRFRNRQSNEIIVVSDSYFDFSYSNKDRSKFKFNGVEFLKGPLVNEVIRQYVNLNPNINFKDLEEAFPRHLQGSLGVFTTIENAEEIKVRTGHKRHYIDSQRIIDLADCQIATSTEWNTENIAKFINRAKELGLRIE